MPPTPEERLATLEADTKTHQNTLNELRADVKALPATVAAQMRDLSDQLTTAFRRETRRCRRIQQQRCPAAGKAGPTGNQQISLDTWGGTIKQAAVGFFVLGMILGSVYLGVQQITAGQQTISGPATQTQGGGR